jgi:hypothetical protein
LEVPLGCGRVATFGPEFWSAVAGLLFGLLLYNRERARVLGRHWLEEDLYGPVWQQTRDSKKESQHD